MDVVLRGMRADDLDRVRSILAYWNMAPTPASPEVPNPELPFIPVDATIVATVDGAVVGAGNYVLVGRGRGETLSLAVDPAYRRAGIGTLLQTARLERMKALGVTTVVTDADRPETIDWYIRKFGYRVVGTRPKRHAFGLEGVDFWTVLELDLRGWSPSPR